VIRKRIPIKLIELIKKRGGAQTTKKGKKGYKREENKKILKKEVENAYR